MLSPRIYKSLVRPLLFRLPPETAQAVAEAAMRPGGLWRALGSLMRVHSPRLAVDLCGVRLPNPVGLAAGYDKDCRFLAALAALGFGYVTGGTVTEHPRPGNPRPRVVRRTDDESLVNSLGFPSRGLEFAARQLARVRPAMGSTALFVSVSGVTVEEIVRCHRRLEPMADAVEVNISSPNTQGLRVFQEADGLAELLVRLNDGRSKPLLVKLPPFDPAGAAPGSSAETRERVMDLVGVCVREGVDCLTVANTWPVDEARLALGSGGLSGRAISSSTPRMVAAIRSEVGDRVALNACGGISGGEDAWSNLQAGATTVQLLTGLVYQGPGVIGSICRSLLSIMDREGVEALG